MPQHCLWLPQGMCSNKESPNTVYGPISKAIYGNAVSHLAALDVCACASKAKVQDKHELTELLTGGLHLSHWGSRYNIIWQLRHEGSRVF